MSTSTSVLRAQGASVHFGGVKALDGVDLEVRPGQIVGLIGPNGAGKTSFVDALTGFVSCDGRFELDTTDMSRLRPHGRARLGLARTWQSVMLFEDLTVRENLTVATHRPSLFGAVKDAFARGPANAEATDRALEALQLTEVAEVLPSSLSHGRRNLVGVARALAADPKVLALDEPAAGLDTGESEALGRRLRQIADGGPAMLLIDHDMGLVLGICDYVYVLEFGKVIAKGSPAEIRDNPEVIRAYLGGGGDVTPQTTQALEAAVTKS